MSVAIFKDIIQAYHYELCLEHALEEENFGTVVNSQLIFESHIEAKLYTQMMGRIRNSFTCCVAEIVIHLYNSYIL